MDPTQPSPTAEASTPPENELGHRRRVKDLSEQIADLFKDIGERMLELREIGVPTSEWVDLMVRHFSQATQDKFLDSGHSLASLFDMVAAVMDTGELPSVESIAPIALGLGGTIRGGNWPGVLETLVPLIMKFKFIGGNSSSSAAPSAYVPRQLTPEEQEAFAAQDEENMRRMHNPEGVRIKQLVGRLFASAPKMTDASGKPVEGQAPALECFVTLKAGVQANGALSITPEGGLRLLAPNEIPSGQRGVPGKMVMIEHFFDYDQVADIAIVREVKASEPSRIVTSS